MAFNKNAVVVVFTLALLLVAYGAEAYVCSEINKLYHGSCRSNKNCASDCIHQGFQGGYCGKKGWFRKTPCKCTKPCCGLSPPEGDVPTPQGGDVPAPQGKEGDVPAQAAHAQDGSVQHAN